jgi:hypothetical protein
VALRLVRQENYSVKLKNMATYGRGQMLGSGINPESFKLDYSGMANAAATQAQGVANLGASIGGAIAEVGDYFKKQAEDEKKVQKSLSVAKAIGDLIPGLQPTIQGSLNILNDKELPLSQRTAEADAIADILNLGINEVRNRQDVGLKERELGIREAQFMADNAPSQRTVNLQQGEITETIDGKAYKVPITFNPATGETRRLDGSIVGQGFQSADMIDAGLNLPMPTAGQTAMPGDGTFPDYGTPAEAMVLPPRVDSAAIAAAAELTGGQSDVSNVSPMPSGTPTTTQTLVVDGVPTSQTSGGMIPPGAIPVEVKPEVAERAMTDAERIAANLPAGQYMARFTGDKPSNIKQLDTPPDSLERLKENRMLKADDRISAVIESTDKGGERLINMNEALSLLNSGEVKSGSFGAYKVKAARLLGMDVASEEQFNSLVGNLALEAIDLTKGAISDREMTFFREELAPGINKSVEGNKKIIEFKIAAAKRGLRINQVAREMLASNALPSEIESAIKKIQNEESLVPSNTTDQSTPKKPQSATDRLRGLR